MSSHSQNSTNNRLSTRQASAQAQRQSMTERRQKLTQRIRKQKKSNWLAQKRGVTPNNNSAAATNNIPASADLSQVLLSFLQQQPSQQSLQTLYPALQAASMAPTPWTLDDPDKLQLAKQFIQRLGETLHHSLPRIHASGTAQDSSLLVVMTLRILVQLTAMHSASKSCNSEGAFDYYGRTCQGWCDLIGEEPYVMNSFSPLLGLPQPLPEPLPEELFHIWKETCWLIGNLAQDLPNTCPILKQNIQPVSTLLHLTQHVPSSIPVVQAASWAFLNILRGDAAASGWDYIHPQQPNSLTLPLLCRMLCCDGNTIQEKDIAVQTAWILVHLSQREDNMVDYLIQTDQGVDMAQTILDRLYQICERAQQQQQQQQQQAGHIDPKNNYFHHPLLEPCLEIFGHWATASNGKHVPRLLSATNERTLLRLLCQMIHWGHQGLLQIGDYLQVLWVAGCLLCDAGTPQHPSTLLAAPALIPLLTLGLNEHSQQSSKTFSLECKREGVLALWNAITVPPSDDLMEESETSAFQREELLPLLQLILESASSSTTVARSNKDGEYQVMLALKDLLLCQDVDAMLAAMHILNAILRNIPSSRIAFMECDGDEALEEICDLPFGNDRASSEAADLAADLIDDFFDSSRQNAEDKFSDPVLSPAQESGSFVFGLNASAPTVFMPDLSSSVQYQGETTSASMMSTDLPAAPPVAGDPAAGHGMALGRGRGRGQTLPAWAQQQQQQLG